MFSFFRDFNAPPEREPAQWKKSDLIGVQDEARTPSYYTLFVAGVIHLAVERTWALPQYRPAPGSIAPEIDREGSKPEDPTIPIVWMVHAGLAGQTIILREDDPLSNARYFETADEAKQAAIDFAKKLVLDCLQALWDEKFPIIVSQTIYDYQVQSLAAMEAHNEQDRIQREALIEENRKLIARLCHAYHDRAMSYADKAEVDKIEKRLSTVQVRHLWEKAAEFELKAAELVKDRTDDDAEPTRSVLFRSAAACALHAEKYEEALRLAQIALEGKPEKFIVDQINEIIEMANQRDRDSTAAVEAPPPAPQVPEE
jgi:tetratricopeptide (TPR) repeat protein